MRTPRTILPFVVLASCTGPTERVGHLAVGRIFSCASLPETGLWCWGPDTPEVQLSDDTTADNGLVYAPLGEPVGPMSVDGYLRGIVGGELWVFGPEPVRVDVDVVDVQGAWHERADGTLVEGERIVEAPRVWSAWQRRLCVQRGDEGITCPHDDPTSGLDTSDWDLHRSVGTAWTALHTGPDGVCAVAPDGRVDCFGRRVPGFEALPRTETGLDGERFVRVATGEGGFGCAFTASGRARCWDGTNDFDGANWLAWQSLDFTACALAPDGDVTCQGDSVWGEGTPRPAP